MGNRREIRQRNGEPWGTSKKVKTTTGNHGETRQCNGETWGTMGNIKKSKKYYGEPQGNQTT